LIVVKTTGELQPRKQTLTARLSGSVLRLEKAIGAPIFLRFQKAQG
jgi:hypothetical protein